MKIQINKMEVRGSVARIVALICLFTMFATLIAALIVGFVEHWQLFAAGFVAFLVTQLIWLLQK